MYNSDFIMKELQKVFEAKMTVPEIIIYCKNDLGILFERITETEASEFLQKNNFFLRIIQYAEVWEKTTANGKYENMDFAHLIELSTIDMFFRKLIFKMAIDFEHYLKVALVNECQHNIADDGYEVVENFLNENTHTKDNVELALHNHQFKKYSTLSCGKDISSISVWTLMELIGFNDLILFYDYYYTFFRSEGEYTKHFDAVRRLRNATAHNDCLLCNFKPIQHFNSDATTTFELLAAKLEVEHSLISDCMKVPLLNDLAVMFRVYSKIVSSDAIKDFTFKELKNFFEGRMIRNKELFENLEYVKNAYRFTIAVIKYYGAH